MWWHVPMAWRKNFASFLWWNHTPPTTLKNPKNYFIFWIFLFIFVYENR